MHVTIATDKLTCGLATQLASVHTSLHTGVDKCTRNTLIPLCVCCCAEFDPHEAQERFPALKKSVGGQSAGAVYA